MTDRIPGKISAEWFDAAAQNVCVVDEIEDAWQAQTNNPDLRIERPSLNVWTGSRWMGQEEIDDICRRIDAESTGGSE